MKPTGRKPQRAARKTGKKTGVEAARPSEVAVPVRGHGHDGRATGVSDSHYDLISVIYHALQGAETCAQYCDDARESGKERLAQFFENCQEQDRERALEGLAILNEMGIEPGIVAEARGQYAEESIERPL